MASTVTDPELRARLNLAKLRAVVRARTGSDEIEDRPLGGLAGVVVDGVGYVLVDLGRQPIYLRQMFIGAPYRRHGYATAAFGALCDELQQAPLEVEVFAWNGQAVAFWQSVGFAPRVMQMRRS